MRKVFYFLWEVEDTCWKVWPRKYKTYAGYGESLFVVFFMYFKSLDLHTTLSQMFCYSATTLTNGGWGISDFWYGKNHTKGLNILDLIS